MSESIVDVTLAQSGTDVSTSIDEEIALFDASFQARMNEPLTKFERLILKSYLNWKLIPPK